MQRIIHYKEFTSFRLVIYQLSGSVRIITLWFGVAEYPQNFLLLKNHPTDIRRIYMKHGNKSASSSEDLYTIACFMFLKDFAVSDLFHIHVASHLFILLHAICFLVERFQVLLIPYFISHRKQFIIDIDLNHLDSCGIGNSSCLSFIFGKCFNGISKLCYYVVLRKIQHFFFLTMTNDVNGFILGCLIAGEILLTLKEIALIDNKVIPQTLSLSFISENQRVYISGCGRVYSDEWLSLTSEASWYLSRKPQIWKPVWFLHLGGTLTAV